MKPQDALTGLRSQAPLVHCITNYVAMNIAANTLLAAGGSPAMIHSVDEVADFAPICGAVTINIGTLDADWLDGMKKAAEAANGSDTPWVLDPVAHFATPYRAQAAKDLLALKPTILRGNASEVLALSGQDSAGKGVDAGDAVSDAEAGAIEMARDLGIVLAISGEVDFVTDGTRSARITGGSEIMPKITALGCSLTGLMGGFAAVAPALEAAVAAQALFGLAGTNAAKQAQGPGSFQVHFLDQLHSITPADLAAADNVTWL